MSNELIGSGPKIPNIPITQVADAQLRPVVDAVRTIFNTRAFSRDTLDHWVTWRDLVSNNIVVYKNGGVNVVGAGSSMFFPAGDVDADFTPPPAPANLTATAAALNVILEWNDPNYPNLGYAEVWRSTTNDLGTAARIGSTISFLYADNVGAASLGYYYWVRFVSKQDIVGPYNSLIGTFASSGYVGGVDLSDLAITAAKLAAEAVESGKIKDFAVTTTKIANLAVGNAAIQNAAITNAKIADLAVDSAKIADASIVTAKIADANITNAKIGDAQITGAKIAFATIGTANITNGAITNALIGDAAITTAKIGDAQITGAKIANATIGTANIGDAAITNAKIGDGQITTAKIGAAQITAATIADGNITNAKIQDGSITNAKIGDAQITAAKIGDAQITTAKIGTAQVDTLRIAGNAVTTMGAVSGAFDSVFYLNAPYGGQMVVMGYLEGISSTGGFLTVYVNGAPVFSLYGSEYIGASAESGPVYYTTSETGIAQINLGPGNHSVYCDGSGRGYTVVAFLTQR